MAKATKKPVKKAASKPAPKKGSAAKAKTPTKSKASAPAKAAKSSKGAAPKGGIAKSVVSAVGKLLGGSKESKPDAKAHKSPAPETAKSAKKPAAAAKKKKEKKGKEGFELEEDDLLASDEEMGSEEIPDLSEFEEAEIEEVETDEDESEETSVVTEAKPSGDDEIVLTDAEGRRYCRVRDCDQISVVEGYCRFHYLLLWKKIQVRRKILADGKLERYVDELTSRYPDKFLEMIRKDLRTEKDFLAAIAELEIDESAVDNEFEDEAQSYVDEIRGMSTDTGMSEEEEF